MVSIKKAALYIRVSTDAQAEEGYSIDAQKEMLAAYCTSKGIKEYEYYIDGGFTGSNIERPEMQRLVEDVKKNKIDAVVVYKLDRLSRSQKDTLYLIEDVFNMHKAEFVSLNESLDTSTPMGRAMLGIMSAFAQLERETIRERTRMGMKERVKSGLWMGGGRIPFGYDYDRNLGILVKNEDSKTVETIYELYLQGHSAQKIADMVGLKYDKLAMQILARKTNTGVICYNGVEYKGKHEPLVSLETYEKVMDMMKERSARRITTSEHLLQGLLVCGKCGAKMHYKKWGKNGYKVCCYSQQTSKKHLIKDPNCDNLRLWADEIEDIVIKDILSMSWEKMLSQESPEVEIASPVQLIEQQHVALTAKIKKLYNLYASSSDEILLETIEENKKELERLKKMLDSEKNRSSVTNKFDEKQNMLKDINVLWYHMTFNERQNVVRNLIEKVVVNGQNLDVHYNLF